VVNMNGTQECDLCERLVIVVIQSMKFISFHVLLQAYEMSLILKLHNVKIAHGNSTNQFSFTRYSLVVLLDQASLRLTSRAPLFALLSVCSVVVVLVPDDFEDSMLFLLQPVLRRWGSFAATTTRVRCLIFGLRPAQE